MDYQLLEQKAKYYIDMVVAGILEVQANPDVQALEDKWPTAKSFAAAVVGAIPYVRQGEIALHILVKYGPLFYKFATMAGIKPADVIDFPGWKDSSDPGARQE